MASGRDEFAAPEPADSGPEARALLRAAADALLDPLVLLEAARDSAGEIVDFVYREVNQATCDYLELAREELLGRSVMEIMPGIRETLFPAYIRIIETGAPLILDDFSYDNEILADTRIYDLRAARAAPTSITLTWRDVTERYQWTQRVAESEARARLLLETAAVAMNISGPDGRFQSINPAMCTFFGYDAEALLTMTWQELTAPEYLEADLAYFRQMLDGRIDTYRFTKQYLRSDGTRVWGDLSVACLRRPGGEVEVFIAQIVDITREMTLAHNLEQQSRRLAAELRSAADYVASLLPADIADGPVLVSGRFLPAAELAGDCFDYRWVDDDHLMVYLIDVSGHGIEPALLSVSVHNMLRSGSFAPATLLDPVQVLTELNKLFEMDQQHGHYLTMWFAVYEQSTRTLRYASAGSPPALAFTAHTGVAPAAQLSTGGRPLGMFDDSAFTASVYPVPHGCRLLLYSDGAYEFALRSGQQLSLDGFTQLVTRLARSADATLDDLVAELRRRARSGTFDDDLTLVGLRFD